MRKLTNIIVFIGIAFVFLANPRQSLADCSINQAGPAPRPVSCPVGAVTYWCTTTAECQLAQNPAINQPAGQGNIGAFSDMFQDVNKNLIVNSKLTSPDNFIGNLINTLMPIVFVIAGLGLLAMLMSGGFQIMTAVQDPHRADEGKQRIVAALVGFFILFASYWLIQALEVIFGFKILS